MGFGPEYDVPGQVVTADGTVLPGEIDTWVLPMTSPVYADPTLSVAQTDALSGGQAATLDQIGDDRGINRLAAEPDPQYRTRVQALPDTVSPAGLKRQMDAAFFSKGLPYDLIETWENRYQSCWDAPLGDLHNPTMGTLAEGTFAYDDPREDAVRGLWMSIGDFVAGLVLVVPDLPCISDRGMAYDDPSTGWHDQRTNYGMRADSAYDVPNVDSAVTMAGYWDGYDLGAQTTLGAMYNLIENIKGGGMQVSMVLAPPDDTKLTVPVVFPPGP